MPRYVRPVPDGGVVAAPGSGEEIAVQAADDIQVTARPTCRRSPRTEIDEQQKEGRAVPHPDAARATGSSTVLQAIAMSRRRDAVTPRAPHAPSWYCA